MTDDVTIAQLLEHLKSIQSQLSELKIEMKDLCIDLRGVKTHMAGFMQNEIVQDGAIASLKDRLERIERRLEISDHDSSN